MLKIPNICGSLRTGYRRLLRRRVAACAIGIALLALVAPPVTAQTIEELKKELEQLKADNETRVKALEARLAQLEQSQSSTKREVESNKSTMTESDFEQLMQTIADG